MLLNLHGWNTNFSIALIPLILLLAMGTKMEHVMDQLAQEIAWKHLVAMEAVLVVKPSDEHFWFKNSEIVLVLIHFISFWITRPCSHSLHFQVTRTCIPNFIQRQSSFILQQMICLVVKSSFIGVAAYTQGEEEKDMPFW